MTIRVDAKATDGTTALNVCWELFDKKVKGEATTDELKHLKDQRMGEQVRGVLRRPAATAAPTDQGSGTDATHQQTSDAESDGSEASPPPSMPELWC